MSHPLRQDERFGAEPLGRPWAAAPVRLVKDRLVVAGAPFIAKADTVWLPLPARLKVVAPDGGVLRPSPGRTFYITAETFDPSHAVLEAESLPLRK